MPISCLTGYYKVLICEQINIDNLLHRHMITRVRWPITGSRCNQLKYFQFTAYVVFGIGSFTVEAGGAYPTLLGI